MSSIKKTFNAVDMMRRIRDQISAKIEGMTLEEELAWLASQDLKDPLLERLRQKAAQRVAPSGAPGATRRAAVPGARKERSRRPG